MNFRNIGILLFTAIFIAPTFSQDCPELDPLAYGDCDMPLGVIWTEDGCDVISGCSYSNDEECFSQLMRNAWLCALLQPAHLGT